MERRQIGATMLDECPGCEGVWLDSASFDRVCAEREQQAAVLGAAAPASDDQSATGQGAPVRYIPCPECAGLMNRINFAKCSGVIVDTCKKHGIWFDRDELRRIVEFIRAGGLDKSRAREKEEIHTERERLRQEQRALDSGFNRPFSPDQERERDNAIAAARGILKLL